MSSFSNISVVHFVSHDRSSKVGMSHNTVGWLVNILVGDNVTVVWLAVSLTCDSEAVIWLAGAKDSNEVDIVWLVDDDVVAMGSHEDGEGCNNIKMYLIVF